jgi:hypothetical protein
VAQHVDVNHQATSPPAAAFASIASRPARHPEVALRLRFPRSRRRDPGRRWHHAAVSAFEHHPPIARQPSNDSYSRRRLYQAVDKISVLIGRLGCVFDQLVGANGVRVVVPTPPERNCTRHHVDAPIQISRSGDNPTSALGPGSIPQHEKAGRVAPAAVVGVKGLVNVLLGGVEPPLLGTGNASELRRSSSAFLRPPPSGQSRQLRSRCSVSPAQ